MGLMTYLLTWLFINKYSKELGIQENTQSKKHTKRQEHYLEKEYLLESSKNSLNEEALEDENEDPILRYDAYRAFWACLSKITKQVWRFLKNAYRHKSSSELYNRQLRPMLEKYL